MVELVESIENHAHYCCKHSPNNEKLALLLDRGGNLPTGQEAQLRRSKTGPEVPCKPAERDIGSLNASRQNRMHGRIGSHPGRVNVCTV